MADLKEIAEQLVNPGPAAGGGDAGGGAEQTEFDVILNSAGAAKLAVVKEVLKMLRH